MALSVVSSVAIDFDVGGWTPTGGTTPAINTTGANLLVVSFGWYSGGGATVTISDNKGNTWFPLTTRNNGTTGHRIYYAKNAIVGTGHTFTAALSTSGWPTAFVYAVANGHVTLPFDVENGATGGNSGPLSPGSITPSANGAFIVAGLQHGNGTTASVTVSAPFSSNLTLKTGGAAAYTIQSTAAAINPSWGFSGGNQGSALNIASFLEGLAPTETRNTQEVVELLSLNLASPERISQVAIELLSLNQSSPERISQYVVEILSTTTVITPPASEKVQFLIF